jgi:DMSO/TMAO reductase YedYZ molybdopterin-dependent catalytic subunit
MSDRTPDAWPVFHRGDAPTGDSSEWNLRVWGQVRQPDAWSLERLRTLPTTSSVSGTTCPRKGFTLEGKRWAGVSSRELIARVAPLPEVTFVMAHGYGEFRAGFSLASFAGPDVLLAWSCDGDELSREHGGPLRLIVPTVDLCKSVKWVEGLEFLNKPWPDSLDEE